MSSFDYDIIASLRHLSINPHRWIIIVSFTTRPDTRPTTKTSSDRFDRRANQTAAERDSCGERCRDFDK